MAQTIDPTDGEIRIMQAMAAGCIITHPSEPTEAFLEALQARGLATRQGTLSVTGKAFIARYHKTLEYPKRGEN